MMLDIEPFKTLDQACFCDDCVKDFTTSASLDLAALLAARIMDRVVDIHGPSFYNLENAKAVRLFEAFQAGLKKDQ